MTHEIRLFCKFHNKFGQVLSKIDSVKEKKEFNLMQELTNRCITLSITLLYLLFNPSNTLLNHRWCHKSWKTQIQLIYRFRQLVLKFWIKELNLIQELTTRCRTLLKLLLCFFLILQLPFKKDILGRKSTNQ